MGMQERQILFGIELPLASPIVVGGIRTALLQVIGTATIGAIVSFGGLGRFIIDGIANHSNGSLYAGVVLVAGLAIGADLLLGLIQRWLTPRALRPGGAGTAKGAKAETAASGRSRTWVDSSGYGGQEECVRPPGRNGTQGGPYPCG